MATQLILNDGTILLPLEIMIEKVEVDNTIRDALVCKFDANDKNIQEMDILFSEANCEKLIIVDSNDDMYIHNDYAVRESINKRKGKIQTENGEVVMDIITVVMAKRTEQDKLLKELKEQLIITQLAVRELYEAKNKEV